VSKVDIESKSSACLAAEHHMLGCDIGEVAMQTQILDGKLMRKTIRHQRRGDIKWKDNFY
jgi:hypothetical protein